MSVKLVLTANTFVALAFGCAFVMAPAQLLAPYGITTTAGGGLIAQLFGAALVAIGLMCWLARDAAPSVARRALIVGLFAGDAIGFVAALLGQLAGVSNALGWTTVALYLLLGGAYGYILFGPQDEEVPAGAAGAS